MFKGDTGRSQLSLSKEAVQAGVPSFLILLLESMKGNDTVNTQGAPGAGDAAQATGGGETGGGEAQSADRARFGELRGKMAEGKASYSEKQEFKTLNDQLHFNAPKPTENTLQNFDPNAPRDELSSMRGEAAKHFEPAQSPDDYKIKGVVPEHVNAETLEDIKAVAFEYGMSPQHGTLLLERVLHQVNADISDGGEGRFYKLSDAALETYKGELLKAYGGDMEKICTVGLKAENLLKSKPEVFANIEKFFYGTSISLDPQVWNLLASIHDARGMKLPDGS